jgi:hypothetical protein
MTGDKMSRRSLMMNGWIKRWFDLPCHAAMPLASSAPGCRCCCNMYTLAAFSRWAILIVAAVTTGTQPGLTDITWHYLPSCRPPAAPSPRTRRTFDPGGLIEYRDRPAIMDCENMDRASRLRWQSTLRSVVTWCQANGAGKKNMHFLLDNHARK